MNTMTRRAVIGATAISMAVTMAACGKAGGAKSSGASGDNKSVGLLLPENSTTRYEQLDKPQIEAKIKAGCPDCTIDYANAAGSAATQAQQVSDMITRGVKVMIVDAVDSTAIKSSIQAAVAKGIKVVAYDRLAQGPISAYVSYDNEKVGELQGQALLDALGPKATPNADIVMIDGDDADPNAAQFKAGAHKVLDGKVKIAYEQSGLWKDTVANQKTTAAITQLGAADIAGVYAANDAMAGGVITALKGAGIAGIPVTGQDAEIAGLQRILAGTQSSTVYKAPTPEADNAATLALDLLNGRSISSVATATSTNGSGDKVPSVLLTPVSVTRTNLKDTVIADKVYPLSAICTADFAAACVAAAIK